MKNILIIIVLILSVFSTQAISKKRTTPIVTKEQKTKVLIKKYLFEHLNDFNSYEPVLYSQIDTLFSSIESDPIYKTKVLEAVKMKKECDETQKLIVDLAPYSKDINNDKDILERIWKKYFDKLQQNIKYVEFYKGNPIGFKLNHKYRANNLVGAKTLSETVFGFNFLMTEIIYVKAIEKN